MMPQGGKTGGGGLAQPFFKLEKIVAGVEEQRRLGIWLRRIGIDQRQQADFLAESAQPLRDREGDHAAERMPAQPIGAMRLDGADFIGAEHGEVCQPRLRRGHFHESGEEHAIKRLILAEQPREIDKTGNAEKRWPRAGGPNFLEDRLARDRLLRKQECEPGDGGSFEKRGQRELAPQGFFDPAHQINRQQRMPAQIEKIVMHANRIEPQHLLPDFYQPRFELIGRRSPARFFVLIGSRDRQSTAIEFAVGGERHAG